MDTKEKLKKILIEWQEFKLPKIYKRDFDYSLMKGGEILSIIGARRAGKTYLCYQLIEKLRETYPIDNILYINFEDERLYPLKGDELTLLWEVYLELFSVDSNKKVFLFADEIQNVKNWSKWARRITEQNKNLKLIITGSSSKLLSKEIATELRGRTLSFAVYPLSFLEYLNASGIFIAKEEFKTILYSEKRISIKKHFRKYLENGGFPAILESGKPQELLKEYYKTMFYRDLADRYKIKNIKLLEDYLTLVIDQTASPFTISSTAKKLEEFGYSLSKNTLSNFSKYAEDIFLIFRVKKYSYKIKEQLHAPQKIYIIDHGLLRAIRFFFTEDYGRLLENIVFISLKQKNKEVFYHQEKKECDFLVTANRKVKTAIQVVKNLGNLTAKKRELEGLIEALKKHNLKEGLILTEDEYDSFRIDNKLIKILPIWYWLITLSND